MIGCRTRPGSETESVLPSATADGHNVYQARYTHMAGNDRMIGHQTDLQLGGEIPGLGATAEGKTLKASDFVTRVGRREDLKSDGES